VVPLRLDDGGFDLIAEAKLASPSGGRLAVADDSTQTVVTMATELAATDAAAISVLTEPDRFDGDMVHLELITQTVHLPVLRKDFLVDPIQVLEARAGGASGVLLIVRIVESSQLVEMTDLVLALGMFCLVEIFDESDLDAAAAVFDREILLGVNARDLGTLQIDPSRHERLAPHLPAHIPTVAESGVHEADDVSRIASLGYRLALVGTALTKSVDPSGLANSMIESGRRHSRLDSKT
jgi:indole-3-glycerol phosphate synthase